MLPSGVGTRSEAKENEPFWVVAPFAAKVMLVVAGADR